MMKRFKSRRLSKLILIILILVFAVVSYTLLKPSQAASGDVNGDGSVNGQDWVIMQSHMGQTVPNLTLGDLDGNGLVNVLDINLLMLYWGSGSVSGIIVSPSGNDTTGNGTAANPFKTMSKAQSVAIAGSNIYLRAGVYTQALTLSKSGTSTAPITYSSYPGETAILDGNGTGITSGTSIIDVTGSYINVTNFEFRNSAGRAISFKGASNSSVKNSKMHDTQYKAISVSGSNILIEGNEVWNATMVNNNNAMGGASGWPQATGSIAKPDGTNSTGITFKANYIHDSWGEGIDLIDTSNSVIDGNKVVNCYSVLIYLDDSHDVQIYNNYVAVTDSKYNRNFNGNPATGFSLASENGHTNITNVTLANNVVAGGVNKGIGYTNASSTSYGGLKIYYNTIKGSKVSAINIDPVTSPGSGNEIKNNIVYAGTSGGSLSIGNISAWTIDHNDFPNGIPSGANGAGTLASDPQLISPVVGGAADGYKVQTSSPVIGKATPMAAVPKDYFGTTRSASTPTMGFFESSSNNSPPASAGYFTLQPVGAWSTLPSGSQCSTQVHYSTWEPRPDNTKRNHIMPNATAVHNTFTSKQRSIDGTYDPKWDSWLLARVDGQFTGTTDEIFQWAACKWGLPDNYLRAEANQESTWFQYLTYPSGRCYEFYGCGDRFSGPSAASEVYCDGIARFGYDYQVDWGNQLCPQTFSIMGIKSWWDPGWGFNWTDNQNGTFPYNRDSTAFAVDYMASQIRGCYEGWEIWLRDVDPIDHQYAAGDLMACAGVWFSGNWYDAAGQSYASSVQNFMNTKPWLQSAFYTEKPPCSPAYGCPGPDPL